MTGSLILSGVPYRLAVAASGRVHLVNAVGDTLCHLGWRCNDPWFSPLHWPTVEADLPTCRTCADAIHPSNDHKPGYRKRAPVTPSPTGWPT